MTPAMTFRHVLMLRFVEDATEEQKQAVTDGLAQMPELMDFIKTYEFGPDLGLGADNADLVLVADFDSEEDWRAYSDHPEHLDFVVNVVRPVTAEAQRVQYLV